MGSGGNLTRLMALEAGFPVSTPALTVDMQCASALAALSLGYGQIRGGPLDVVLAGVWNRPLCSPGGCTSPGTRGIHRKAI